MMAGTDLEVADLPGDETRAPAPAPTSATVPPFKILYRQYFDFVWSTARRLGIEPSGMDDLIQEVFIAIHGKLHTLENPDALRSWIYGVVRRTASNHRRAKRARGETRADLDGFADTASALPTPLQNTERSAEVQLLMNLLGELDEAKREIFALVEIEELSVPDAADALGIPLNTAYSRLRAARLGFEAALARHEARNKGI